MTTSVEPKILWDEATRKRVSPRRVEDLPVERKVSPKAAWTRVVRGIRLDAFERVLDHTDDALKPAVERSIAIGKLTIPPAVDDAEPWAVALRVLSHPHRGADVIAFVYASVGIEKTVDLLAQTASYQVDQVRSDKIWGYAVRPADTPSAVPYWFGLRSALLRAEPEVRTRCRERLLPIFERGTSDLKALVVQMFPDDQELATELAREYLAGNTRAGRVIPAIYGSLLDRDLLLEVADKAGPYAGEFADLLDGLGLDALPVLRKLADKSTQQYELEQVARTLAVVRSEEVARFFGEHFGKIKVRKIANDYFPRFPELIGVLRPFGDEKGRAAKLVRELVERLDRATASTPDVEEASADELPPVLVSPPWRGSRKKRKPIVVSDPSVLPGPVAMHLDGDPMVRLLPGRNYTPMTPEQVADWKVRIAGARANDPWNARVGLVLDNPTRTIVPPAERLEAWNAGWPYREYPGTVYHVLAEAGVDALPGVETWAQRIFGGANAYMVQPLRRIEAPGLAPAFAIGLRRRQTSSLCREWFRNYPEAGIAGLLPAAVGKKGRVRAAAELALRWLAEDGHEERIRQRAEELGERGTAAVDEILGWDPLLDCPSKPPKLPKQYRPEMLPRPVLKNGKALPMESLELIGEMLKFTPPEDTYAGLVQVREACDERSIAEFSWSLAESWENSGADKRNRFMYLSLIHFADDEVTRRTTPALKNGLIVDVLRHIGTEAAQIELATVVARSLKRGSLYHTARGQAEKALDDIADENGLSRDDLDDRLTPILGLDEHGGMTLDLGSRVYKVGFDEHLSPLVIDGKGNRRKAFPRGGKKDDPEKLAAAKLAWNELKEDVESIAILRIDALERAMLGDRRWEVDDFRTYWAEHRLMMHLARRMVWMANYDERPARTFRVTEDGSLGNADDEPFDLAEATGVSVPHVLDWPDDTLERWRELFADYELIQPFPQLDRTAVVVTEQELASHRLERRAAPGAWDLLHRRLASLGWTMSAGRQRRDASPTTELRLQRRHHYEKHQVVASLTALEHHSTEDGSPVPLREADSKILAYALDTLGVPLPDPPS